MSNASGQSATLEPHLSEFGGGRGGLNTRYPNPFFDLGQQYTPRTVKELFRWCTFFYYTHPLVNSTVSKISRYPITDLIYEDPDERVKERWETFFDEHIKIKDRLMETNLDLNVYGNAFVSLHFPFTRWLICQDCGHRSNIEDLSWKWGNFAFNYTCPACKTAQVADPANTKHIKDIPYRSAEDIKIVRWNPENIAIRYNEATGESHYFYNLSRALCHQIDNGEREIVEKLPLLFLLARKHQRVIRMNSRNIFHLKRPTLAEKDMGWGKPLIQAVMKDLYYMAILRKAQEAIANEHIVPFDFLFPQANAQMDPFVHTDLGSWRNKVEEALLKKRRDPNYKAVMPVPIGNSRIGGNGKALMLTPELNYLNQLIVGGMGIPQEFIFGGLNWTGSSITLRSLSNDFQHNQTELLDLTVWIKNKVKVFMRYPDIRKLRFMDFKMADDIQRIQQIVSLNAQNKVSDETMLTEFGLDYEKEVKKRIKEIQVQNEIQDLMMRSQAKSSGEAQIINWNYQQKLQELQRDAMEKEQKRLGHQPHPDAGVMGSEQSELGQEPGMAHGDQMPQDEAEYLDQQGNPVPGAGPVETGGQVEYMDVHRLVRRWAEKLVKLEPQTMGKMLSQIKAQNPQFGAQVEKEIQRMLGESPEGEQPEGSPQEASMEAMPEKGAPRRGGSF